MTLPPNFGRAVDLSSLGKPAPQAPATVAGISVTPTNLTTDFLEYSSTKPANKKSGSKAKTRWKKTK